MHRALLLSEIVDHICQLLSREKRTLARLARTARALHEPAIDALWWSLGRNGLERLLRCMPPDLWVETGNQYIGGGVRFTRAILPTDWDRLMFYARRVRALILGDGPTIRKPETMDKFVTALLEQHPDVVLFPNLRDLKYHRGILGLLPLTLLLRTGSTLKSMLFVAEPDHHPSIFKSITDVRPPLEALKIDFQESISDEEHIAGPWPSGFIDMLRALPQLKSLFLYIPRSWLADAAVNLPNFPFSGKLCISAEGGEATETFQFRSPTQRFPSAFISFRRLELHLLSLNWFITTMQSIPALHFCVHSLRLLSFSTITPHELKCTLEAIYRAFDSIAFKELRIETDEKDIQQSGDGPDVFVPLQSFTNLESLILKGRSLRIDDTWLKRMVDTWPKLKHLHIVSADYSSDVGMAAWPRPPDSYITVDGLLQLTSTFHSLLSLTCRVDLREASIPQTGDAAQKDHHNELQVLTIHSCSLLGDITNAANVLCALFPRLHTISSPPANYSPPSYRAREGLGALVREKARERRSGSRLYAGGERPPLSEPWLDSTWMDWP